MFFLQDESSNRFHKQYLKFSMGAVLLPDLFQHTVRHILFIKVDQLFDEVLIT